MSTQLHILIVSTSLHPDSKSRRLARAAENTLQQQGVDVDFVDLQDKNLPFCDGVDSNKHPEALELRAKVEACDGVLLTAPVYNYDVNAAAKNFIELTGRAWTGKVVAMAVSAGGQRSGMSPMGIINSLMLDFRCIVIPRFVYAARGDFNDDRSITDACDERVAQLCSELKRVAGALKNAE